MRLCRAALGLALFCLAGLRGPSVGQAASSLLDYPVGFKVSARLVSEWLESDSSEIIDSVELYSNEQKRSRIHISGGQRWDSLYAPNQLTLFYDQASNQLVRSYSNNGQRYCNKTLTILNELFGKASGEPHVRNWLEPVNSIPAYVNGFARLLLILDANRSKLQKAYLAPKAVRIRSQYVDRYTLTGLPWPPDQVDIVAYFVQDTFDPGRVNLPVRTFFKTNYSSFSVDFKRLEILDDPSTGPPSRELDYQLDDFAFPVGRQCSALLPNLADRRDAAGDPKAKTKANLLPQVFSMFIEREDVWLSKSLANGRRSVSRQFIAFDGYQRAMRRDTIRSGADANLYSTTIHDFKTQTYYHLRQDLIGSTDMVGPDQSNSSTKRASGLFNRLNINANGPAECLVASAPLEQLTYNSLIPIDQLVYMGTATVRGIKCRVFELETSLLPPILFEHVLYTNTQKSLVSSVFNTAHFDKRTTFTLVYYVAQGAADNSQFDGSRLPPGPLVRVDLIHEYGKTYQLDVYEMMWQLADSPNGHHQMDLFTVGDLCASSRSNEANGRARRRPRQSSLSMELQFVGQPDGPSLRDVRAMLGQPLVRNKALARGLSSLARSQLTAIQLSQMESRTRIVTFESPAQATKLQVVLTARLATFETEFYSASSLAKVSGLLPGSEPTTADSFVECYWQAAHARRAGPLLFAFLGGRCFIDFNPHLEWDKDTAKSYIIGSSVFKIDWKALASADLLQFRSESYSTEGASNNNLAQQKSLYKLLYKQTMQLPMDSLSWPASEPIQLAFQVSRLEIGQSALEMEEEEEEGEITETLTGLTLAGSIRKTFSQPDLEACRSACMADLECRSYSVCFSSLRLKCTTSSLAFRDPKLLSRIKLAREQAKGTDKTKSFNVTLGPENAKSMTNKKGSDHEEDDDDDDDNDHQDDQRVTYELIVDKQCRIYNKRAIELFTEIPKGLVSLDNRKIRQADSEEQCAELCLAKNVKYLKQAADLRVNWTSQTKETMNQVSPEGMQHWRNRLIRLQRTWCATFRYLNLEGSSAWPLLQETYKLDEGHKAGICLLSRPTASNVPYCAEKGERGPEGSDGAAKARARDREKPVKVRMESFEFVYRNLYRVEAGLKLLEFIPPNPGDDDNQVPIGEIKIALNRQKTIESSSIEECSRLCFSQSIKLIPICKSFDVIEKKVSRPKSSADNTSSSETNTYCVFNTMSLHEASMSERGSDLVSSSKADGETKVWHYEPREEYMLDSLVLATLLDPVDSEHHGLTSSLGLTLVVLVSIVSGVLLGQYVTNFVSMLWFRSAGGPNIQVDSPLDSLIESSRDDQQSRQGSSSKADGL